MADNNNYYYDCVLFEETGKFATILPNFPCSHQSMDFERLIDCTNTER